MWWKEFIPKKLRNKPGYIKKAKELFPDHAFLFRRHDQAEAALIAYRAYRHVKADWPI